MVQSSCEVAGIGCDVVIWETNYTDYLHGAGRKVYECSYHREMINVSDDDYVKYFDYCTIYACIKTSHYTV